MTDQTGDLAGLTAEVQRVTAGLKRLDEQSEILLGLAVMGHRAFFAMIGLGATAIAVSAWLGWTAVPAPRAHREDRNARPRRRHRDA